MRQQKEIEIHFIKKQMLVNGADGLVFQTLHRAEKRMIIITVAIVIAIKIMIMIMIVIFLVQVSVLFHNK